MEQLLTLNEVLALDSVPFGKTKLYTMINAGTFPAREKNHGRWVKSKIEYAIKFGEWSEEGWKQWELAKHAKLKAA